MGQPVAESFMSDALRIHLELTRKEPIKIHPLFYVLVDVVRGYKGKEKEAEELLREYHHRYTNWQVVIDEAWRYTVSNISLYEKHEKKGLVVYLLAKMIWDSFRQSVQPSTKAAAIDRFLAFWIKMLDLFGQNWANPLPDQYGRYEEIESEPEALSDINEGILRLYLFKLASLENENFQYLLKSYYSVKAIAKRVIDIWQSPESFSEVRGLLYRVLHETFDYWLQCDDPCAWLCGQLACEHPPWLDECKPLSLSNFLFHKKRLQATKVMEDPIEALKIMLELPDYKEVVKTYASLSAKLKKYETASSSPSMLMRLKIIQTKGLEAIHEETLRSINQDLAKWLHDQDSPDLKNSVDRVLDILEETFYQYPEAALHCIQTIGREIIDTDNRTLIDHFIGRIVGMGFQTARVSGVSAHWQVQVNQAHLLNIRVWLDLIKRNPRRTKNLLSALIVYLALTGTCIRDTDLFQRDVSELLHADIAPVYNLVKQLAKLFPVYFNEIGAEGLLRSVSTQVDEIYGRGDPLIHFLRKQSHVESNNFTVPFIENIFRYWKTLDIAHIEPFLPEEVLRQIDENSPLVQGPHAILNALFDEAILRDITDLLYLSEDALRPALSRIDGVSDVEKNRFVLMVQFYQLLHEKYALSPKDIKEHLHKGAQLGLPDPGALISALESDDPIKKLDAILNYLEKLQNIILTPSELKVQENIYLKRHIAVDIPSMYGSYHERKFDALGLTFRLENLANILFEEIIQSLDLGFITRATFSKIVRVFPMFLRALELDGIRSIQLQRYQDLFEKALEVRRFTHSQYMDIFRGFSEGLNQLIHTHYHSVHENNLTLAVRRLSDDEYLAKYRKAIAPSSRSERIQMISEAFLRDLVARTFGLQYFDNLVSRILVTLSHQKATFESEDLDLLLSYEPEKTISWVYDPSEKTYDIIHLGNKGYNLAVLHKIGVNVPPGFIITTEYFRCRRVIERFRESRRDFEERVMSFIKRLEKETGKCFGCPVNTLLVSVRSGAAMSMPGMMTTFLNVGINEKIVEGLIAQTGQAWFAWDNFRRFIQSWGMSFGVPRDLFDEMMLEHKKKAGVTYKREFTPEQMRDVAKAYRAELESMGIYISDDPKEQLFTAITQVIESWNSPKARTYRQIMGLSDCWGTAVTVQAMIFGNLNTHSGAGVMFTHDPWTAEDEIFPNGDFTLGNQGEDVVGGLVKTLPISEAQRLREAERKEASLEALFPRVYKRLVEIAEKLVNEQHWGPQEIEFTFQGNSEDGLFVLQSRNMAPRIQKRYRIFVPTAELDRSYLASGVGVSGGAICGRVAFDVDSIENLRKTYPDDNIILIRSDTVPDDIKEISLADGILTGKGGATSHAAIVAHRLGKTCVVGCDKMVVWESERWCNINGRKISTGDFLSLDGRSGAIYLGKHETVWNDEIETLDRCKREG
ncbi:MAG: hypothetical protein JRI45_05510 [Deltaproteobacteria bacterium]|nr:hypothetical protein [Deltaproteobacteria bacterium]MBW2067794.1 hypothetical protein [Deltaproteobacteria bacterium]